MKLWRLIIVLLLGAGCSRGGGSDMVTQHLGTLPSGADVSLRSTIGIPTVPGVCVALSGRTRCVSWREQAKHMDDWGISDLSLGPIRDAPAGTVELVALTPTDTLLEMDIDPVETESAVVQHEGRDRMVWRMIFVDAGTSVSGCARVGGSNVRIGASFSSNGASTHVGPTSGDC